MRARDIFNKYGMSDALSILKGLFKVHLDTLKDADIHDNELEQKLRELYDRSFPKDLSYPIDIIKGDVDILKEQRFVGYGEVMSAHVLSHLLETRYGVAVTLLTDIVSPQQSDKRDISTLLRDEIGSQVARVIDTSLIIVPGYVSITDSSILDAYGRGYTDKMAERIAVGLADL
jgi:aspartokinase